MPTKSLYPPIDIPNVDVWTFLFERKDREYPDDKGEFYMAALSREYLNVMTCLQ